MSSRVFRIVFGLYAALIVATVVAANLGGTNVVFGVVADVPYGDKLGHFLLMGVLAMLADLAARHHERRFLGLRVPTAPAVVLVLVFAEELSQLLMATRTFDLVDFAADVLGVIVFVSLARIVAARMGPCDSGGRPRSARRS